MDTAITIMFMVLALFIIYIPWLFFGEAEKLTGQALGEIYPRFKWINRGFPIYNAIVWLGSIILIGLGGVKLVRQGMDPGIIFFGGQFAGIAAFHGLFAAFVAVCPIPTPKKYLYIHDDAARFVGLVQLFLGIAVIVAAYFSTVLTAP